MPIATMTTIRNTSGKERRRAVASAVVVVVIVAVVVGAAGVDVTVEGARKLHEPVRTLCVGALGASLQWETHALTEREREREGGWPRGQLALTHKQLSKAS